MVEWMPSAQKAMADQVSNSFMLDNGALATGHQLSAVPDSMVMQVDAETLDYLIMRNADSIDKQQLNWTTRDWMIVTGGYSLLSAAELDAENFTTAGYDIQVFFRGNEFRTAIVGYDSAEAATLDLVKIRTDLRASAQRDQNQ